jgi:hypothetical protein
MKRILFFIALMGWVLSLLVNLSSYHTDISNEYPFVMFLHVGVFIVIIPTIVLLSTDDETKKLQLGSWPGRIKNPLKFWEIAFKNSPVYLSVLAGMCFIYTIASFIINFGHSNVPTIRLFSGHWMAFYSIALAILYPFKRKTVL